jgi:hypothetical protein
MDTNNGKSKWCKDVENKATVAREYQFVITTRLLSLTRQRLWCESCSWALRGRQWQRVYTFH